MHTEDTFTLTEQHVRQPGFFTAKNIRWAIFCLLLLLLVAFFAGLLPAKPVAVATGSMEPAILIGDAVVLLPVNPDNLEEGDVIQYQKDGYSVIHRIVEITESDGERFFITKGDNNNAQDADPVSCDSIVGRVAFTIPKLGYVTLWLHGQLS